MGSADRIPASAIPTYGFDERPALRRALLAFVETFCAEMTLARAGELDNEAFVMPTERLNTP